MSRFSMVSTCRRISRKNAAVCSDAGRVRNSASHTFYTSLVSEHRVVKSTAPSTTVVVKSSKNYTQNSSSSDHCDSYKSSSSRHICSPVTSRTTDTPKLLGFGLLTSRRTLGDRSYRSILYTDGYTGKIGVLPIWILSFPDSRSPEGG